MATLAEVLEYGPIVAIDPDTGTLVTVNGAYWNIWAVDYTEPRTWINVDAIATDRPEGMCGWDAAAMWDKGKRVLEDWLNDGSEDDDSP